MQAVLNILKLQHIQNAYSCITMPNPASLAIHEHFGFMLAGTHHRSGYKFGQWHDVIWLVKALQCYKTPPMSWIRLEDLHIVDVEDSILKQRYLS